MCTSNLYLAADSAAGSESMQHSGNCGFSPNPEEGETSSLITELFANNAIDSKQLTVSLKGSGEVSFLEFGTPTTPSEDYFYAYVASSSNNWYMGFIESSFRDDNAVVIYFDPMIPYIMVPTRDILNLVEFANTDNNQVVCEVNPDGQAECTCDTSGDLDT
eukprot:CAMPEP_0168617964 /NCGR_PEP_ID=MMETSP0449_2-20121227/5819_1 /TAXON_ID=1082188 /ORGANISM="Strombidium rassoulzadegani, Strain ras09" /LENGTH=160 /DNA_ID=CAMNT_0008658807 /DNA_START=198 /DNA_END=676 /DNA_ORIENTATION=+